MKAVAIKAAKKAGKLLLKDFGKAKIVGYKKDRSIVTETDLAAEKIILGVLRAAFPRHAIFSEEAGLEQSKSDYLWIVDPLDGTTNFSHGIPFFDVSIALAYKQQVILGVVYNPVSNELYVAEKGKGAQCNGKKISVGVKTRIEDAIVSGYRQASGESRKRYAELYARFAMTAKSTRAMGVTPLEICFVASGRLDAHFNLNCYPHDCAAANLIAQEAGAIVSDFQGNPWELEQGDVLVSNKTLHSELVKFIGKQ